MFCNDRERRNRSPELKAQQTDNNGKKVPKHTNPFWKPSPNMYILLLWRDRRGCSNSLQIFCFDQITNQPFQHQQQAIAPESALERLQEINAARHEEELENFHAAMKREKEERLKRLQEERSK